MGKHPIRCGSYVPSPNCPYPWSSGARNLGPNIKGETGFVAILGKTAKIHPKVVTFEIVSPCHKRYEPWGLCMDANRSLASLLQQGLGFKALWRHF